MGCLSRISRLFLAMASALHGSPVAVQVERPEELVGRRVLVRFGTVLRVGDIVVDEEQLDVSPRRSESGGSSASTACREGRGEPASWLQAGRVAGPGLGPRRGGRPRHDRGPSRSSPTEAPAPHPHDPAIYLDRAAVRADAGDYIGAIVDCNESVRLDPGNEVAYVCRGNLLGSSGEPGRALADFDAAIRLDPNYALAHYARGFTCVLETASSPAPWPISTRPPGSTRATPPRRGRGPGSWPPAPTRRSATPRPPSPRPRAPAS